MSGSFTANYNVGGDIDKVKKIKLLEEIENLQNVENVEIVEKIKLLEEIGNLDNVENIEIVEKIKLLDEIGKLDNVESINNVKNIDTLQDVDNIKYLNEIGKIRGFATKTQPYNFMEEFNVPALKDDYTFTMALPNSDCEILAITLTCSGYGEDDHYDLFFNDVQWFKDWYCSEVKEGLFLGTSTYVYAAPANSTIKLIFKNDSATTKKIWLGVRMLV